MLVLHTGSYVAWETGTNASECLEILAEGGTEANSETAVSIHGPAGGGEGFNAARDDSDVIVVHPGVITSSDGLTTSALDESHGWRNPVALIEVTRIE